MIAKIIDKNTIEVYDTTQFDTNAIMHSGQVFRYFATSHGYCLVVGNNHAEITEDTNKVIIKCNNAEYFYHYFDLDTDYNQIKKKLAHFVNLAPAIKAGGGIRILRADFAETAISFIISANNNIKRFTKTLNLLAEKYGTKLSNGHYAFPTLEQLAKATEQDFKKLGCGYRSPYLVKAVEQLQTIDIELLSQLQNDQLIKELCRTKGIGKKVGSCLALFSTLHRLGITPVDTWIRKALDQMSEKERKELLAHEYAGVAQQYIFYFLQHKREQLHIAK